MDDTSSIDIDCTYQGDISDDFFMDCDGVFNDDLSSHEDTFDTGFDDAFTSDDDNW